MPAFEALLHRPSALGQGDQVGIIAFLFGDLLDAFHQVDHLGAVAAIAVFDQLDRIGVDFNDIVDRSNLVDSDLFLHQPIGLVLEVPVDLHAPAERLAHDVVDSRQGAVVVYERP